MSAPPAEGNTPTARRLPPEPSAAPAPGRVGVRLRELHPGWFAAVMGTAILAVATYDNPGNLTALRGVAHGAGVALAVLAYALGILLTVAYAARWIGHTQAAVADLRHPVLGAMHATFPGGLLVLAVMTSAVGPALMSGAAVTAIVTGLAAAGGALALALSVAFTFALFTGEPPVGAVNGGWFIPPVVTVIIPIAFAPLIGQAAPGTARLLLFAGYAAYGIGFLMFLFVMGMLYSRLVLHPLPPAPLVPTLWIGLSPVGVSVLAPLALAGAGEGEFGVVGPTISLLSRLFATAVWGFGLWWLAIAIALLVRYLRAGTVPFHVGWWAFTFPLGAYTVATVSLARTWQLPALEGLSAVLYAALLGFWVSVAARTTAGMRSGRIWQR